jgi:orotate phosphoribosyltransferase
MVCKPGKAHSLRQRVEGRLSRRALLFEGRTTTAASPMDAVAAAREEGAEVVAVATIADRAARAMERLQAHSPT